eukprot:CAMPEP_0197579666 /NCGR_PEP_ID=MMETSP1326-20131121/3625_1 /TAXON_ID=1155430 /ORGANISM="Genus nov. species nov., Strain RCC2288" /LENGTH=249 /DNA_ID=CAMNT_0043143203 /DNA_START=205 /DNA_END=954 /DNA_ORIENTATION=-
MGGVRTAVGRLAAGLLRRMVGGGGASVAAGGNRISSAAAAAAASSGAGAITMRRVVEEAFAKQSLGGFRGMHQAVARSPTAAVPAIAVRMGMSTEGQALADAIIAGAGVAAAPRLEAPRYGRRYDDAPNYNRSSLTAGELLAQLKRAQRNGGGGGGGGGGEDYWDGNNEDGMDNWHTLKSLERMRTAQELGLPIFSFMVDQDTLRVIYPADDVIQASSVKIKRRLKMNKHKQRKRRKRDRIKNQRIEKS